jgi:hypothetical protein
MVDFTINASLKIYIKIVNTKTHSVHILQARGLLKEHRNQESLNCPLSKRVELQRVLACK